MGQQTGAGNDWSEMVEKHDGQCCVLSSRLKPVPRKRCRDIMLGLLFATPSVGSVIWRSGMNGAGGIPFSGEVGTPLSLDEARAVVRGAETGEMGTAEGRLGCFRGMWECKCSHIPRKRNPCASESNVCRNPCARS